MLKFLGIKKEENLINKLSNLGYNWNDNNITYDYPFVFIIITIQTNVIYEHGCLVGGNFVDGVDTMIDIDDVPKRKDLDKWVTVKWIIDGNKMRLL